MLNMYENLLKCKHNKPIKSTPKKRNSIKTSDRKFSVEIIKTLVTVTSHLIRLHKRAFRLTVRPFYSLLKKARNTILC